jgi:hypothetical protein
MSLDCVGGGAVDCLFFVFFVVEGRVGCSFPWIWPSFCAGELREWDVPSLFVVGCSFLGADGCATALVVENEHSQECRITDA